MSPGIDAYAARLWLGTTGAVLLATALTPWFLSLAGRTAPLHLGDHLLLTFGGWALGRALAPGRPLPRLARLYGVVLALLLLPAALPTVDFSLLTPLWHDAWRAATVVASFGLAWYAGGGTARRRARS
jgi:hypothetical protein